jgi:TRAP transporter TAXI family solute receptor
VAGVEDLAGKPVWLGAEGSGTRALAEDMMAALGWTEASFAPVPPIGADRLADALCLGEIDGFFYAIGHPALVIQEATTGCDARLVPISGPAIDELVAARPELLAATIPGGLYRGNPEDTPTFGVGATLVTRADVPDAVIDAVVRAAFGDLDTLHGLNPALSDLTAERMASSGMTAPLHPAAEAYYREQGWIE